jgi:hypothetical protein
MPQQLEEPCDMTSSGQLHFSAEPEAQWRELFAYSPVIPLEIIKRLPGRSGLRDRSGGAPWIGGVRFAIRGGGRVRSTCQELPTLREVVISPTERAVNDAVSEHGIEPESLPQAA